MVHLVPCAICLSPHQDACKRVQEIAETRKPNPLLNYCAWKLHMLDPSLREAIKQLNSVIEEVYRSKRETDCNATYVMVGSKKCQYSLMWNLPFHITIMPLATSSLTLVQPFHSRLWNNHVFVCLSTRVYSSIRIYYGRKFKPRY